MKRIVLALGFALLTATGTAGYGPLEDYSEFVSARLTPDGRTIVFTAHLLAYRPATGIRAFPDGGVPDYVTDEHVIGLFDRQNSRLQILRREKNRDWQPGSGQCTVVAANDGKALVSQGGQLRGPFAFGLKFWLVDRAARRVAELDLVAQLAKRGRDSGQIYLVDRDGTLVFVTVSLAQAKNAGAYRDRSVIPEVWVRTPKGDYLRAATTAFFQTTRNGEVIYWEPSSRKYFAYAIATQQTREAPEFRITGTPDVREQAQLSSNRHEIEFATKAGDHWQGQPVGLTLDHLR